MQVQATNRLRRIILKVDYFATCVFILPLFSRWLLGCCETLCDGSMVEFSKCGEYDYITEIIKSPLHILVIK
jgi:hypothetical protein